MFQGTSLLIHSPLIAKLLYAIAHRNTCTDEHRQVLTAARAEYQPVPREDSNGRTDSPVPFPRLSLPFADAYCTKTGPLLFTSTFHILVLSPSLLINSARIPDIYQSAMHIVYSQVWVLQNSF